MIRNNIGFFGVNGYRAFSHLTVPELGRVNLVVGKNNVGKTMFLEALRLHAMGGSPRALRNLLIERDEIHTEAIRGEEEQELQLRFPSLFHRSDAQTQPTLELCLGEMRNESRRLTITARLFRRVKERQPGLATHRYEVADLNDDKSEPHLLPGLAVAIGDHERIYPFSVINGTVMRQNGKMG
jgi:predicted ATP-dependent endonuclease of OLD family